MCSVKSGTLNPYLIVDVCCFVQLWNKLFYNLIGLGCHCYFLSCFFFKVKCFVHCEQNVKGQNKSDLMKIAVSC